MQKILDFLLVLLQVKREALYSLLPWVQNNSESNCIGRLGFVW